MCSCCSGFCTQHNDNGKIEECRSRQSIMGAISFSDGVKGSWLNGGKGSATMANSRIDNFFHPSMLSVHIFPSCEHLLATQPLV